MRKSPLALFSGIGRHAAWMLLACGLTVLVLGLLVQAGSEQQQYRGMQQQQLKQAATQTALFARGRIDSAAVLLRMQVDASSRGLAPAPHRGRAAAPAVFGFVKPDACAR